AVGESQADRVLSLAAWPNPARGVVRLSYSLARGAAVRVELFDTAGRRLRTLLDAPLVLAGQHALTWDGRDARGRRAAPGVYLLRLASGAKTANARVVLCGQ